MPGALKIQTLKGETVEFVRKKCGSLRTGTKERMVAPFVKTEEASKGAFELLTKANDAKMGMDSSPWVAAAAPKENVDEVLPALLIEVETIQEQAKEVAQALRMYRQEDYSLLRPEASPLTKLMPQVATASSSAVPPAPPAQDSDVFLEFMALAEKIQQQAEYEAHDLYSKMKYRSECIELLTLLLQKLKAAKGDIDWSKNEEMKKMVDKAREMGVIFPGDDSGELKYKWKSSDVKKIEDNIKLLKNNIDQATLLERTHMQKFLQEAAQWLEAISGVLKLRDRVASTFAHNISH